MHLRYCQENDLPQIAEIYNSAISAGGANAYTEPLPHSHFAKMIKEHSPDSYPMIVAEKDKDVLGFAYLSPYRCGRKALAITAELSFYISQRARRQGLASKLIQEIEPIALKLDIESLFGIIMDTNIPSIELMKKLGYEKWAYLPRTARVGGTTIGQVYYGKNLIQAE